MSLASKRAYLKRLEDERSKIHVISPKKRTAWQRSRMRDLQRAISIVSIEIRRLKSPATAATPAPSPVAGLITDAQIKALVNTFKQMGYTSDADIADKVAKYQAAYQAYVQNKPYYTANWQKIYGTSLPDFDFLNNPLAMAGAVGSGTYMGYNLATLSTQASLLEGSVTQYSALAGTGDWGGDTGQLGYEQFGELARMFGSATPTQGEFAQLKTPGSTYAFQGAGWDTWSQRYEDWRKKRKTLYTGEEAKVATGLTEDGFQAPGLKSRQQY